MQYAFNTTLRNTQSTGRVKFKGYIISNPDSHCAGITSGGLAKAFFLGTNGAGPGKGYVRWNFCETVYISAGSSITLNYQYMHLGRGNAPGIIISGNMLSETGWLGNPKYDFSLYVQTTSAQPVSVRVYDGGYLQSTKIGKTAKFAFFRITTGFAMRSTRNSAPVRQDTQRIFRQGRRPLMSPTGQESLMIGRGITG